MSVRAYRIDIKPQLADQPSFNLWHAQVLLDFLSSKGVDIPESGMLEVEVGVLEEATKDPKVIEEDKEQEYIKLLVEDIEWAKRYKEEYLQYECF